MLRVSTTQGVDVRVVMRMSSLSILTMKGPALGKPVGLEGTGTVSCDESIEPVSVVETALSVL